MKSFRRRSYVKSLPTLTKKASVGDFIVIKQTLYTSDYFDYKIGEIFEVKSVFSKSIRTTNGINLFDNEYLLLIKKEGSTTHV